MKYKKNSLFLSLLSLIILSGCNNEKKVETFKTVEYYSTHTSERDTRIKECASMKEMTETIMTDCTNANTSYANEKRGVPLDW